MSDQNKDAERRAEAAFAMQQSILKQQRQFLAQQGRENEQIKQMFEQSLFANQDVREAAVAAALESFEGRPSPALQALLQEQQERGAETIRRNLGVGGETGTPGIEIQKAIDEAAIEATEANRLANIQGTVGALSSADAVTRQSLGDLLGIDQMRFNNLSALGQGAANLGKFSQFSRQPSLASSLGGAAINLALAPKGSFANTALSRGASAIGSGLGSLRSILGGGGGGGTAPRNAFNTGFRQLGVPTRPKTLNTLQSLGII